MSDSDYFFVAVVMILALIAGFVIGLLVKRPIEIQDIKEVDNGYYITINNEIYYKE